MVRACYDFNLINMQQIPKTGCFDVNLSPIQLRAAGESPGGHLTTVETFSNGLYDMVLKDAAGKLYHMTATKNAKSNNFFKASNIWSLKRRFPPVRERVGVLQQRAKGDLKIGDKKYWVLAYDDADTDVERAQRIVRERDRAKQCIRPIRKVREPQIPLPNKLTNKSIAFFCRDRIKGAYDINDGMLAAQVYLWLWDSSGPTGRHLYGADKIQACQNLPEQLPFTRDTCGPK